MLPDLELHSRLLAGRVLCRNSKGGTSGTRFVQRNNYSKYLKSLSRQRILSLFTRSEMPDLAILVFPSTNWIFEGMLINKRCGHQWKRCAWPIGSHTRIIALEREEAIYRSAFNLMPSIKHGLKAKTTPYYASASYRTFAIKRYLKCSFEDMAEAIESIDCKSFKFNAAWLDFNGYLSNKRANAIESFISNHTNGQCRLVITSMNARFNQTSQERWGKDCKSGIVKWLQSMGHILYFKQYTSSVPMIEFAIDIKE